MFVNRPTMESMQSEDNDLARRRDGAGGARPSHRSASNHSSSSTSSDILVAPGPPGAAPTKAPMSFTLPPAFQAQGNVRAEVRDGRMLVVHVPDVPEGRRLSLFLALEEKAARNQEKLKQEQSHFIASLTDESTKIKHETNDDGDDGPNHRGTYSKAYTLRHPEIKWLHRGQGRYIPAPRGGRPSDLIRSQS